MLSGQTAPHYASTSKCFRRTSSRMDRACPGVRLLIGGLPILPQSLGIAASAYEVRYANGAKASALRHLHVVSVPRILLDKINLRGFLRRNRRTFYRGNSL